MAEATTHAETFERHGKPDPSRWEKAKAVTGRPADAPTPNSTLAARAAARKVDGTQAPAEDESKPEKAPAKKAAARKG